MDLHFFPSCLSFSPECWRTDGTYTNDTWPQDAVLLTREESDTYWCASPPSGKQLGATSEGRPCWVEIPPPSKGELVSQADAQKSSLISEASKEISILADAVEFDMATQGEVSRYNALRKYRVEINRVDTSTAPDIAWPQKP